MTGIRLGPQVTPRVPELHQKRFNRQCETLKY